MRLLNAGTLRVEEFTDHIPRYTILSHRWEEEEVTFQDICHASSHLTLKKGFQKLRGACMRTIRDGLGYVWIDTCCIDKTSSAELSESINSMFNWYQQADICYVYLSDVPGDSSRLTDIRNDRDLTDKELNDVLSSPFAASMWFTRGWTLQELIAPLEVRFYNADWQYVGGKQSLSGILRSITGIQEEVLEGRMSVGKISVARRMSWASRRQTTRIEDNAYCLLGIFEVGMPLLYGEGARAFVRLQQEIAKFSSDQSIFAWESSLSSETSLFAYGLREFEGAGKVVSLETLGNIGPFALTNRGVNISLPLLDRPGKRAGKWAILACRYEDDFRGPICLSLESTSLPDTFLPSAEARLDVLDMAETNSAEVKSIYIMYGVPQRHAVADFPSSPENLKCWVRLEQPTQWPHFKVCEAFPDRCWNKSTKTMWLRRGTKLQGAIHLLSADYKEVVVAFGYERTGTRVDQTSWTSEWVWLGNYQQQKSMEQMCNEAAIASTQPSSALSLSTFSVTAAIALTTIMGETLYVIDVVLR